MSKARNIIEKALRFGLNKLAVGETLNADDGAVCLDALNNIADEWNGAKGFLFREILTTGVVSGVSGTLGGTWPTLAPGDLIEGATVAYPGGTDLPLAFLSMDGYANIAVKTTASIPSYYTPDGYATVYFWPACAGQTVTLRTRQSVAKFADLDTDYGMPAGYESALVWQLAETVAPALVGGVPPIVAARAQASRSRIGAQAVMPAIIQPNGWRGNILTGWNR